MVVSMALAAAALPTSHAAAEPPQPTAFDHGIQKNTAPGTHGPLPAGFSRTELTVKFRADRKIRLTGDGRTRRLVAHDSRDARILQRILDDYPGATIRRMSQRSETAITAERVKLEKNTKRALPDLNAWFAVAVPTGIEGLLEDLNALPSVEIAQSIPELTPSSEPLQSRQLYRNPANSSAGAGVDADYANALPGGKGQGITLTDVEGGTNLIPRGPANSLASGNAHSLMVADSIGHDEVWAWGANNRGQLGISGVAATNTPWKIPGLTNVIAVSAAQDHSAALLADGTVWMWGENGSGQLGDSTTTDRPTPVQVPGLTGVTALATGPNHTLAVLGDGTVKAWGSNSYGKLGNGTTTNTLSPVPVPGLTDVTNVAAGLNHSVARLGDGTLRSWGRGTSGELGTGNTAHSYVPTPVSDITDADMVSAAGSHTLALTYGATVMAWGLNTHGQLGDGTTVKRLSPITVPGLSNITDISAGSDYSVVRSARAGTEALAWGNNNSGQLGDGTTVKRMVPTVVATPVDLVRAGKSHTVVKTSATTPELKAWGSNTNGQLGDGTSISATSGTSVVTRLNQWNTCHEEFTSRATSAGPPIRLRPMAGDPCESGSDQGHGTASAAVGGAADDNGAGIAGIAPYAKLQLNTTADAAWGIDAAIATSQAGDVILLEIAKAYPADGSGKWWPVEYYAAAYDQIVLATAKGITVVEAAGNGDNSLDDANDAYAVTIMDRPDSGALMVGAGEPPSVAGVNCAGSGRPLARTPVVKSPTSLGSTYGSRVDVQGYGLCVTTAITWSGAAEPNKVYSVNFTGTSAASAMIAPTVAALQGVMKARGQLLTPAQVRDVLRSTGTPQQPGPRHIGPLPNLRAAIESVGN
ncbi:S8 family serine peptidase [Streptomyces polyrhachis]|uniref:S8 family serine peptidase n=1 Tax=Streptomyces polyrhachis TaxID=1282885 RepID=A0ABW2GNY4_9ACTN